MNKTSDNDNGLPSHIYAFEFLGWVTFFVALLLRGLGRDIYFLRRAPRLQKEFWNSLLEALDIRAIDFQKCKAMDGGSIGTDYLRHGSIILGEISLRSSIEELCVGLFPDIESINAKAEAMLLQRIQSDILSIQMMAAWVDDYKLQYPGVGICVVARKSLPRQILLKNLSIPSILIPVWIDSIGMVISGIIGGLAQRFKRKTFSRSSHVKEVALGNSTNYPVIFFPHKGTAYGNLYEKNQFYSDMTSSPFHPSNILHIDIHGGRPASEVNDIQAQSGRYPEISLPELTKTRALSKVLRSLSFYLKYFWGRRGAVFAKAFQYNIAVIIYICIEHLRFQHYVEHCRQFKSAKIALVGYEILFPKPLALALESLCIKTVASQERFLSTFTEGMGFIVDTYFVPTVHVGKYLQNRKNVVLKTYIPVGQVRSDTLHYFECQAKMVEKQCAGNHRPRVLVLDFHSELNLEKNRLLPLNNYLANRQFYMQIAQLAAEFSNSDFIIRGKNDDWFLIGEFKDIAHIFETLPNVTVSRDYSRFNIQYELAASADVVIARHTSLGDECLGAGKPVIFVDYFPNSVPYIEKIFDYEGLPVIAHDYDRLKFLLSNHLENPEDFYTPELLDFRKKYYGLHDGKVRERIAAALDELYVSCQPCAPLCAVAS